MIPTVPCLPAKPGVRASVDTPSNEGGARVMASGEDRAMTAPGTAGNEIAVENPATGEVIAHVPDLDAAQVAELARAGRAAQPAWEALGFEGRGRILRRMQKWLTDHEQ